MTEGSLILAPLRGVTIRCFRETFAAEIAEAGFTEAVTPFITANAGVDPLKDREIGNWRIGELANDRMGCGRGGLEARIRGDATLLSRQNKEEMSLLRRDRSVASPFVASPLVASPFVAPPLVTPQFIGKDPGALRYCLERIKSVGYTTADLNCGCPFPMVRNKGRGSGILRTPDVLRQMMEVGCEVMGPGNFSIKARLGVERTDELLKLMPLINAFPLRYLTVHARTAKQMYEGACDWTAGEKVVEAARVPVVLNGDLEVGGAFGGDATLLSRRNKEDDSSAARQECLAPVGSDGCSVAARQECLAPVGSGGCSVAARQECLAPGGKASEVCVSNGGEALLPRRKRFDGTAERAEVSRTRSVAPAGLMIGRSFVRALGARTDSRELLLRYIEASQRELSGDRPVLGRMKELLSYWKEIPYWSRRWNLLKICRSVDELRAAI